MEEQVEARTQQGGAKWIWIVVALAVIGAGAGLWLSRKKPVEAPAQPAAVAQQPAAQPDAPLPPVEESDKRATGLLEGASPNPLWKQWLASGDLVQKAALAADNVSEGVSPRKPLSFLAPKGTYQVVRKGGKIMPAPETFARWDAAADVVASLNAGVLARVATALDPMLSTAIHQLGYPNRGFRQTLVDAMRRVAGAPPAPAEVELEEKGALYKYKDPQLESLGALEKHLLRLGKRNQERVQAKARELLAALGG